MKYRSEIDGLRALAVVPVILFHAGFNAFSGGFVGVDVFFVISGYLITAILLNDLEAKKFSIVHFYERRARRILPALFLVMCACVAFAWFMLYPMDMKQFSKSIVAVALFASNIFFWSTSGYFDTATELKPLIHTWSLSVEEQYYVLFPLFLFFAWRLGKSWTVGILAIFAVGSLALAQWFVYKNPSFVFYLLPTRAWELLIGAFVAFYYSEHSIKKHKYWASELGSLLGFALIAYATFAFSEETPFPSVYALAPTIGAALIIIFATNKTLVGKLLSTKPFLWIGLLSYSAYLWHQPLFAFARLSSFEKPSQESLAFLALITLPLAYLTWRFVERPFRNKHIFDRKQIFIFSIIGIIGFSLFGFVGWKTLGYENRLAENQRDSVLFGLPSVLSGSPNYDKSCQNLLGIFPSSSGDICITNSAAPEILVYGDSHASAIYKSVYENSVNLNAMIFSRNGCFSLPNLSFESSTKENYLCKDTGEQAQKVAQSLSSIKTVIIGHRFPDPNDTKSGLILNGQELTQNEAEVKRLELLTTAFTNLGKQVVIVIDTPLLHKHPRNCLQKLPMRDATKPDCQITRLEYQNFRKEYVSKLEMLVAKNSKVQLFDPIDIFCEHDYCKITEADKSLYYDVDHISSHGSFLIIEQMIKSKAIQ